MELKSQDHQSIREAVRVLAHAAPLQIKSVLDQLVRERDELRARFAEFMALFERVGPHPSDEERAELEKYPDFMAWAREAERLARLRVEQEESPALGE